MNLKKSLFSWCVAVTLLPAPFAHGQTSDFSNTQFEVKTGLPSFEYMEAPDRLPNYTAGAAWGTQGQPITTMQKPLSPEASMPHYVTFPEFDIDLYAAEPDIHKPIWLAFDHRGRLWISETVDYPNELQPRGQGRDRLKIVEDTDGDGKADKFTIFADQLSIPTSFVFVDGGVIVVHSGKMELLKDTNGDDVADERQLIIEGWGTNDTHATVSNLRYGFDNWIWGVVGYSGFTGSVNGKELRFGQGVFRFKPDGSALEFIRSTNNNTWGLDFTEDNIVIGSTANNTASFYMPIPNRYYEAVNGWSAARLESIATSESIYPITEKVRQVDWHGLYTAGSGSGIYTARSFPKAFWNSAQFVAEPTGHLLGMFMLESYGADYVAHNVHNMLASDDEWAAPIYGEVGPDGSLWVVDWYNYIIQHNPAPRGFTTGKGNAYATTLRDKTHGRIYRMTYRDGEPSNMLKLDTNHPQTLIDGLKSPNKLWRMHAQRLLVERGNTDVLPQLASLVRDTSVDAIGLNPPAIHALWTMHGLGAMDGKHTVTTEAVHLALAHPSAAVRRAAIMVAPRNEASQKAFIQSDVLKDTDAQVRLAGFLAFAELPQNDAAATAILNAIKEPRNHEDRWLEDAAIAAAAKNDAAFLRAFLAKGSSPAGLATVMRRVTAHYADRGPTESIVSVLTSLKGVTPEVATVVLDGLMNGWPDNIAPRPSDNEKRQLESVMDQLPIHVRDRLLNLGERWKVPGLFEGRLQAVLTSLKNQVIDTSSEDAARAEAAQRWIGLKDNQQAVGVILNQISLLTPPTLSSGMITALAGSTDIGTAEQIMTRWDALTPAIRRVAISVLIRRPEWALVLLDAVEDSSISRTDIAPEHWTQLSQHPNHRVAGFATRLSAANAAISSDRAEVVEKLLPLAKERGDAKRGEEIFEINCGLCHKHNGKGGVVGPDLTGISSRDRTDVLLEILDPNRSVEANYRLWTASTKDGNSYSGRLETETQTTVEILDITGQKHVIQRKDIESLQASPLSIMPIGFEALPPDDLKALLEYLATPH